MSRTPRGEPRPRSHHGQNDASGGGSAGTGGKGAPSPSAGASWCVWGAPIPSTADPGRAEQTRHRASRSFVQWRAPPGRPAPRPLHGVWVDGGRDGSWGEWWESLVWQARAINRQPVKRQAPPRTRGQPTARCQNAPSQGEEATACHYCAVPQKPQCPRRTRRNDAIAFVAVGPVCHPNAVHRPRDEYEADDE